MTSTKTKDQVEGGLLLDVVVAEGTAIFQLLSSKDETLLIRGDSLLVLDLGLHIVDGIARLDIQGDSLSSEGLDKDLREQIKRSANQKREISDIYLCQKNIFQL